MPESAVHAPLQTGPIYEAPPTGPVGSGLREGDRLVGRIAGLSPSQAIVLVCVILLVVVCVIAGWALWEMKEAAIRHEAQQREYMDARERGNEAETERGRQFMRDERAKDRRVQEDSAAKVAKSLEENSLSNREVKTAVMELKTVVVELTRAVNRKSGGMIDP